MDVRLPEDYESKLKDYVQRYPSKKSAIMPAIYLAQQHYGWLPDEAYQWVSSRLELPLAHVRQVATFYTMYYKEKVGRYHFQICRTLSCMICGSRKLTVRLGERFGIDPYEVSEDGSWSYEEVECLGSCGTAPMVQINDVFFECLTVEQLDEIIDRIEKEQPDLRFNNLTEEIGAGLPDFPRSQNWKRANG